MVGLFYPKFYLVYRAMTKISLIKYSLFCRIQKGSKKLQRNFKKNLVLSQMSIFLALTTEYLSEKQSKEEILSSQLIS